MTSPHELKAIESKLDTLIRLLALQVVENKKSIREKALVLRLAGIGPSEIAKVCNTTSNTINVALSSARRKSRRTTKKASK